MPTRMVPIDSLAEDPANARRHPERNLETIKGSLLRFGQVTPLVIDGSGVVRKGNGTLRAMRQLREAGHPSLFAEVEVVELGLEGADATAYAIVDNRSSEQAEWDQQVLAETLEALRSEPDFPIELTGFSDDEVDALLEQMASDAAGGDEGDQPPPALSLAERFGIVPFSVLDARQGYWQDRKRAWIAGGIKSEIGRGEGTAAGTDTLAPGGTGKNSCWRGSDGMTGKERGIRSGEGRGADLLDMQGANDRARRYAAERKASRANATPGGSKMPAADYSNRERGTGNGRAIPKGDA